MRLLLIAAACIAAETLAFSLNLFSSSRNSEPYLHPLSPSEVDPSSARAKRQAYQVYVDGDSTVSVDKTGQADSGPWGPWTPEQCSRTCGGGVQTEKRQCGGGDCSGPSVRYISCNIEACPEGTDYRAEQCTENNDKPLDGNYHKWLPYKGKNKCELICRPEVGNFYYKWADKVVDGTPCDAKSNDICVDGVCLPRGCDGMLGSTKKMDKCGVCDGDNSKCKTVAGSFDERNLAPGYHDVIKLPVGATGIRIEEARTSSNSIALKNGTDHYYLNGKSSLIQADKEFEAGGTVFEYDDSKPERLEADGPLTEELTVAIHLVKGNKDSAIRYEFSIPVEEDVDFLYKPGEWSACSVTCGKGKITRTPYCIDTKTQARVNDAMCDDNNATKPEFEKDCETVDCEAEWFTGEWEQCSQTCGDQGEQYRVVYCHQVFANGRRITVDDDKCSAERPPVRQSCNRFSCPEWQAGPWSACSEKCGDAWQYRSVTCRSEKEGEEGKLLPAEACDSTESHETKRTCNLGPCEGLKFFTGEWDLCQKCNDTEETREVTCKDKMGRAYALEKCLTNETNEVPIDKRSCATQQPCIYEWTTSQWTKCSTECGHGHKNRKVFCAIHQLGDLEVVDEFHCQGDKPEDRTNCTNEEKCTGTWYYTPWTDCTEKCGGGSQERTTVCLNYDKKPMPEWCDEAEKPSEKQDCNVDACPTCFDSDFGCCPDNSTFATGEFNEGCSNCSTTEFGCCADNYTISLGANGKGCEEYVEEPLNLAEAPAGEPVPEGSGAEPTEGLCKVTNEQGEEENIDCASATNATADATSDLLGDLETNGTIHCSKTEFGCCPDWFTAAAGKDNEGCEDFVQGACNGTQFGCCLDEVTLARGANYEGCGEPSCAASLYGCCKDRKTIAFGPHYAGCERSSFPCELSSYGCCPDGETAALGKNGTGCGENCLTTKYGCCPDGSTTAKGHHNEGCGCVFAQFGCCPDGKTAAKGAGFYGCPDTCAQSQFGCCPDGKTSARGANKEGCPCQYTRYGCCPDGETTALGPKNDGCDDCRYAKYSCCPDGETKALGPNHQGCPSTTVAPFMMGGTVAPSKIAACSQKQNEGTVCAPGYKLQWFYDSKEGRCAQFWYGGCDGNDNRFPTQEQCETICVEPPSIGRCYLPKVEGPLRCDQPQARYWYDHSTKQCAAFWWRGCLGNANNFASWEECSTFCRGVGPIEEPTTPAPPPPPPARPILEDPAVAVMPVPDVQRPVAPQEADNRPRPTLEEVCRSTEDSGPCTDYSEQWFYSAYKGKCEKFTYGGCGGNLNRFRTEEECSRRCGFLNEARQPVQPVQPAERLVQPQEPVAPASPVDGSSIVIPPAASHQIIPSLGGKSREACSLKNDVGRCKGSFDSWYFEVATGTCVSFKYTGCGGNANRFGTKEACEDLCLSSTAASDSGFDGAPGANKVCDEAKDTGPCENFVTKWFYNKADGTCNRFHFGGCQGTGNRFDNEQQCKAACSHHVDACELPAVGGPCSGKHKYYFYNKETKECEQFSYGGCLGNTNRFGSIEECQARCQSSDETSQEESESAERSTVLRDAPDDELYDSISPCRFDPDVGHCKTSMEMWYFDYNALECKTFNYSGCGGNPNKFHSEFDCRKTCPAKSEGLSMRQIAADAPSRTEQLGEAVKIGMPMGQPSSVEMYEIQTQSAEETDETLQNMETNERFYSPNVDRPIPQSNLPELCRLPEERGPCFDNILRWRYDSEVGSCVSFMYGGCDHNANYFTEEEACERACGSYRDEAVCSMPHSTGNCDLAVTKWYFDSSSDQCKMMMWTGCGGNMNRFTTRADCDSLCKEEVSWKNTTDVCDLPRSSGPCDDAISMWYFDKEMSECRRFTYSGCRGNGNKFETKKQCETSCASRMTRHTAAEKAKFCGLPFETGPCSLMEHKFYFDAAIGRCQAFTYGGCEGNGNRFDTVSECENACSSLMARTETRVVQPPMSIQPAASIVQAAPMTQAVKAPQSSCLDVGGQATCALIVKTNLCTKKRYATYCCETCKSHGFKF